MGALHAWLLALFRETPIVLAGEDLQWSDPSTLRGSAGSPGSARRSSADSAGRSVGLRPRVRRAQRRWSLDRLDASDARSLARRLAARRSIKPEIADRVAERSDGVPLFIEELLAAVTQDANGNGLPSSLQSSQSTTRWTGRGLGDGTDPPSSVEAASGGFSA